MWLSLMAVFEKISVPSIINLTTMQFERNDAENRQHFSRYFCTMKESNLTEDSQVYLEFP
jgi:hypothetical protein